MYSAWNKWVVPFGHPRIGACWRLPVAYRSQPRPSSASDAKASPGRPFALDLQLFSVKFRCLQTEDVGIS